MDKFLILNLRINRKLENPPSYCDFFYDENRIYISDSTEICRDIINRVKYFANRKFGKKSILNLKWISFFPRIAIIGDTARLLILFNERSKYAVTNFVTDFLDDYTSDNSSMEPPIEIMGDLDNNILNILLNMLHIKIGEISSSGTCPKMLFFQKNRAPEIEKIEFFIYLDALRELYVVDSDTLFSSFTEQINDMKNIIEDYYDGKILSIFGSSSGGMCTIYTALSP